VSPCLLSFLVGLVAGLAVAAVAVSYGMDAVESWKGRTP